MAPLAVFTGFFQEARDISAAVDFAKKLRDGGLIVVTVNAPELRAQLVKDDVPHRELSGAANITSLISGTADKITVVVGSLGSPVELGQDVGSHSLIRAAATRYQHVAVAVSPSSYDMIVSAIKGEGTLSLTEDQRRELAISAFSSLSSYDKQLSQLLSSLSEKKRTVLVVGGGGREHAISWKLSQSPKVSEVFVAPGNGGTSGQIASGPGAKKISNLKIPETDHQALIKFCKEKKVDLCVVGPEAPLIAGLSDAMTAAGIPVFGPSKAAAILEESKAFSKAFMSRHNIPTARYETFTDYEKAREYVEQIDYDIVIKASGIAAGKGVILPKTKEEALATLKEVMVDKIFGAAGEEVVIEELLEGEEVSLLAFSDGERIAVMPGAQDHKRVFDDDMGPNTGGMGAYAPAPALTPSLREVGISMIQRSIDGMKDEGRPYKGVLYAGLMLTKKGPYVLEYNCRFGDPETQVLLPLLESDLSDVMLSCINGTINTENVHWKTGAAATVVAASGGYPGSYPKGKPISGLIEAAQVDPAVTVFHAGTKAEDGSVTTSGGRVLAVTAYSSLSLKEALQVAYSAIAKIHFEGMHYRKDIGRRALLRMLPKVKIGVLGSTRGSSLQPVLDAINQGQLNASVQVIISNKEDAPILERARSHGVEAVVVSAKTEAGAKKTREEFDREVTAVLKQKEVELVLLVGYMRILSAEFCRKWENRCLNVHPSLLPEFKGGMDLEVHSAVIKAGKRKSGCTVHLVTEEVDGGPIVVQMECPVLPQDTPEALKKRVQALEGISFIRSIQLFQEGKVPIVSKAQDKVMAEKEGEGPITYKQAGVDIDAGEELVERIKPFCKGTRRPGCDADLGGFGGLFDLNAAGYGGDDTVLVACNDGVGTKLKVALLAGKHDTVGIDLVAMSVNDLIVQGAEPLFFLDYYACGKLEVDVATAVVKGIALGCQDSGCGLIGGETAEMPSMYHDGDYDLAGFAVGAVRKSKILPKRINVGDVVLGLPSSGVHSNGYSLVRKLVDVSKVKYGDKCPFDSSKTLGEALLEPTRIYVKALMPSIQKNLISALAHITGGGLTENIPRVLPEDTVVSLSSSSWSLPPVFGWLQKVGKLPDSEMVRTFNCGIGMVVVVEKEKAEAVKQQLKSQGETFFELGTVTKRSDPSAPQVVIEGALRYQ